MEASGETLLIRADASAEIGMGHVMRCLALAQAWADRGGRAVFAIHRPSTGLAKRLSAEGFEIEKLAAEPATRADARETRKVAERVAASWCVIDGYAFDSAYVHELSETFQVLRIDDYQREPDPAADLTLNPNYDPDAGVNALPDARLLSGSAYTLLRRPYRRLHEVSRTYSPKPKEVLVTFGGSDLGNLTSRTVEALRALEQPGLCVSVVVGALNPRRAEIEAICRREGSTVSFPVTVAASDHDLAVLMGRAELCLIAAGNTLWEAMSTGLPIVSYAYTLYQQALLGRLDAKGYVGYLGAVDAFDAGHLRAAVGAVLGATAERARLGTAARQLIDGQGAERVADRLASTAPAPLIHELPRI